LYSDVSQVFGMLYFSYGSNMSSRRLLKRVSCARFVTTAVLQGHQLRFHKRGRDGSAKCDAFETKGGNQAVRGVIYAIAESDKPLLDRIEGLGRGYEEKRVELATPMNEPISAFTYYATAIDSGLQPYHWYMHHVVTGALEYDLPLAYIEEIRQVASVDDPDPRRHALEMAIYESIGAH
jgi:hypothetical protein